MNRRAKKEKRARRRANVTYYSGVAIWVLGGLAIWWFIAAQSESFIITASTPSYGPWPWLLGWTAICSIATLTTARIRYDREMDRRD